MEKRIIHLNVADFAVAVERVVDRRLRTRAVIVSQESGPRAVVYDMSDEAYRDGVRKGMVLGRAKRLARTAAVVSPKLDLYERAMKAFAKHALPFSPLVESGGWDGHVFLDVSGVGRLFGPPQDIARSIRLSAVRGMSLNPVWAVASNKLVSKVATRLVKPFGECVVPDGDEEKFVRPVPLPILPGMLESEIAGLRELNIGVAGEAHCLSMRHLEILVGPRARVLYETVRGTDNSPVLAAGSAGPTVLAEHTFKGDTNDAREVESALYLCVERVGAELRGRGLGAKYCAVSISYCDGARVVRRVSLGSVFTNAELYSRALRGLGAAWSRRVRLRHVRLAAEGLYAAPTQLELFAENARDEARNGAIDAALDSLRARFGQKSAMLGRTAASHGHAGQMF